MESTMGTTSRPFETSTTHHIIFVLVVRRRPP
jgi:hypothetical protein